MERNDTESPGSPPPDLSRPAEDEACITVRPEGRQLVISRADFPDSSSDTDLADEPSDEPEETSSCNNGNTEGSQRGGGEREKIDGFSARARRRLRNTLHSLDRNSEGLFIALTYHEEEPTPERCKRDLDVFWKRLVRRLPGLSAVWKMEPHTEGENRGVPHFHLMIFGIGYIDAQWLSRQWHDVTAESSAEHRKSSVEVDSFINEDGRVQAYLSKYMGEEYGGWPGAEESDPWAEMGRWWGCLGRDHLPIAEWADWKKHLSQSDACELIRFLLDEWNVDLPDGVVPPSLLVNCVGDPCDRLDRLLEILES